MGREYIYAVRSDYNELKHISWVTEHEQDYEGQAELIAELKKYGENPYVYYQEAMEAWGSFGRALCNNPYVIRSGKGRHLEEEAIFPRRLQAFLVYVPEIGSVPAGFLLQNHAGAETERLILEQNCKNWQEYCQKVLGEVSHDCQELTKKTDTGVPKKMQAAVKKIGEFKAEFDVFHQEMEEWNSQYMSALQGNQILEERFSGEIYVKLQETAKADFDGMNQKFKGIGTAAVKLAAAFLTVALLLFGISKAGQGLSRQEENASEEETSSEGMEEASEAAALTEATETADSVIAEGFDENGFLFADSAERELGEEELESLRNVSGYDFKTLLGFARNELYARKGYAFREDGKYYPHYMQYDWYKNMEHVSEIGEGDFTPTERKNLDLIIRMEEKYGYR